MFFLDRELDKLRDLQPPEAALQEDTDTFNRHLRTGEHLLARHRGGFESENFYTSQDAKEGVQVVCEGVKDLLLKWGLQTSVKLECMLPDSAVEADEDYLHGLLSYIIKGVRGDVAQALPQQWLVLKHEYEKRLQSLNIVDESEIREKKRITDGTWGTVLEGEWAEGGGRVAIKKPKGNMSIEGLASFLNEAIRQALLSHSNVVQLHAATKSGWLVMELANSNLEKECRNASLGWSAKGILLHGAAAGLKHLHSQEPIFVHGDVKSANFLVFGTQSGGIQVKISDFGQTFALMDNRSRTIRKGGGTPLWVAPEIYEGKPLTAASDVFSLGVVMYEIVTGLKPYPGIQQNCLHLMNIKLAGKEPCRVQPTDCPPEMLTLMRRCCDLNPEKRPKMAEVVSCLQNLPTAWESEASPPGGCQATRPEPQENSERPIVVSQTLKIRFDGVSSEQNRGALASVRTKLGTLVKKNAALVTGFCALVSFVAMAKGSLVLYFKVDFASAAASDLFKESIEHWVRRTNQADILMSYQHQPEVTVVEEVCTEQANVGQLEVRIREVMQAIADVPKVLYSQNMVKFLQHKIRPLAQKTLRMPEGGSVAAWRNDLTLLLYDMKAALQLVREHSCFDVAILNRTDDTCAAVEHALRAISYFVCKWELPCGTETPSVVPLEYVEKDAEAMTKVLGHVFERRSLDLYVGDRQAESQWELVKHCFEENRRQLDTIPEDEVIWENRIAGSVYEVRWRGTKLAGKQLVPLEKGYMRLEDFQKLHTDAYHASLDPRYSVKLHGVTRSGAILMDLATCNLNQWCTWVAAFADEEKVRLKLRVLAQAARALHSVHSWGMVYGNVNSSNFLLFGAEPEDCIVKIADLPLFIKCWYKDFISTPVTGRWVAKEMYEQDAMTFKSDVFGLGCTAYELVMEEVPYGKKSSEAAIMKAKMDGKQPFNIPEDIRRQWPDEVLDIMERCCLPQPEDRPCMQTVDDVLQQWHPCGQGVREPAPAWNRLQFLGKETNKSTRQATELSGVKLPGALGAVQEREDDTWTALIWAASNGETSSVALLLEKGASVDQATMDGRTALTVAARDCHTSTVALLLEKGSLVDQTEESGRTALIWAARNGNTSIVALLLEKGASVDQADRDGWTALIWAADNGETSTVALLLEKGASVDQATMDGRTALTVATRDGHTSTVALLLEKGASVDQAEEGGRTALIWAARNGKTSTVALLLERGASVDQAEEGGRTALIWAARNGKTSTVALLLERGASVDQ
ncbi:unnamed protein product, partial [Ostreobium quekettii]